MTFFHFTRSDVAGMSPGTLLHATWDRSTYWIQKTAAQRGVTIPPAIAAQISRILAPVTGPAAVPLQAILTTLAETIGYRAEVLKEYIFEHARLSKRPAGPSRFRCAYLFDSSLDPDQYAHRIGVPAASYHLIELEPLPDHHRLLRAQLSLLDCNLQPYDEIVRRAHAYWDGVDSVSLDTEVLFEGDATVIKVHR
jgi:hypothetical protein